MSSPIILFHFDFVSMNSYCEIPMLRILLRILSRNSLVLVLIPLWLLRDCSQLLQTHANCSQHWLPQFAQIGPELRPIEEPIHLTLLLWFHQFSRRFSLSRYSSEKLLTYWLYLVRCFHTQTTYISPCLDSSHMRTKSKKFETRKNRQNSGYP